MSLRLPKQRLILTPAILHPQQKFPRRRQTMPKVKTKSGAKKRFKVTGTGKLKRRHAMKSHILEKKSSKRKRAFGREHDVAKSDVKSVKRLLGR